MTPIQKTTTKSAHNTYRNRSREPLEASKQAAARGLYKVSFLLAWASKRSPQVHVKWWEKGSISG